MNQVGHSSPLLFGELVRRLRYLKGLFIYVFMWIPTLLLAWIAIKVVPPFKNYVIKKISKVMAETNLQEKNFKDSMGIECLKIRKISQFFIWKLSFLKL